MDAFRVDGKLAIVTGASAGIGQAAAVALARAGADIIVLGRKHNAEATCEAIRCEGRQALGLQGALTDKHFLDEVMDRAMAEWGQIDILVNSAGMNVRAPAEDVSESDWENIIALNLTALFRMCQRVGREMIKRKAGKIVNIASIASFMGGTNICAYAASKGGVAQVTRSLANEWAQHGINVNAIAPGYILTDMTRTLHDDGARSQEILARVPAKRWGNPEDVSGAVIFLASPASDFMHGHMLVVDGGWMAR